MVRVRYLAGFCRVYGVEFYQNQWREVNDSILGKVRNDPNWEVEGAVSEPVEIEESVDEAVEEVAEEPSVESEAEANDDSAEVQPSMSMSKAELRALCDEAGLEYSATASKRVLLTLLTEE